jgi:hypothetical protein
VSVTHEHAVEVDTELARLWDEAFKLQRTLGWKVDEIHTAIGEQRRYDSRRGGYESWPTDTKEAVAQARRLAANAPEQYPDKYDEAIWHAKRAAKALEEFTVALEAVRANAAAQQPLADEYAVEHWSRFFLVQNTGGHIHSSMQCSTTFPTTQWAWLPSLSGLGEDAAVEQEGPRLCSACFPSAPVEWTLGLPAKVNPNRCPGSGQQGATNARRYDRCPVCNEVFAVSNTGKLRAHNKPKGA